MKSLILALALTATTAFAATPAKIHFTKPMDKETVTSPFAVEFAVDGMTVEKAGVMKKGTGHHHLIVDGEPVAAGKIVPKDATHLHFGDGATSTTLTLKPGVHTLTLQFADGSHISMGPEYSTTISVTVK
ncbi:MAG: DUF4399 domain-containing protein [Rhizobacter sp.]|nr:DUF4399 domain-containing protein [Bacteriovorax sp.]